ncbi:MAG TPA: hypothetical protein VHQ47_13270 [Phycisphaerae bacterium]|jgi:hypothetical protein|nr:hypothetical protein [Phycisphaerae bacterium]
MSREIIIDCRRLPSMGDQPVRMQLSGEGIETWEDVMPEQIRKILNGRWNCKLRVKVSGGSAEVLGEAVVPEGAEEGEDSES